MKRLIELSAIIAVVVAVYVLRLDDVAGLFKDDAYYVVLARSLAAGQGYALISSAAAPVLPAFPPGFALLLAPIVAAVPQFPDNVFWLKAVSIAAMFAVGFLTFHYFHRCREISWGRAAVIGTLTALTPGFVFLATSTLMSECVFTLGMVGSAIAIEHAARIDGPSGSRARVVIAGMLASATWLIRAPGLAVVAGGAVFLLWRRGRRTAAGFLAVCALCYAPWSVYAATHQGAEADRVAHGGDIVRDYRNALVWRAGGRLVEPGVAGSRIWTRFIDVFARDMGAMIMPGGYRGADESGLEVFHLAASSGLDAGSMGIGPAFHVVSGIASVFVLAGAFAMARRRAGVAELLSASTVAMLLLISTHSFRYVLPIVPFLIGYFLAGVEASAARIRADAGAPAFRIAAGCLLAFLVIEHGQYIWMKSQEPPPAWARDHREVRAVTDFVNAHVPADATAASTNPGLLYLATGRRSVVYIDPDDRWEQWKAAGIRYVVAMHLVPQPSPGLGYRVVYESPRLRLWVLDMAPVGP